jgi:hypothetical protein
VKSTNGLFPKSLFLQPPTSSNFKPAKTASENVSKYLQPEVAKQFDTSEEKTLRSFRVTFSETVSSKKCNRQL